KEITIDKAKTVTAVFVKKQYPLTIEIEGEGTVTEEVIKQGLATDYNSGTIVELTAVPTGDWEFVEWSGDITSTENPTQITIDGPKTVKVKFMRYFNYKVPSHDWENNTPWISVYEKIFEAGFNKGHMWSHANTYWGIGDFNHDGYLDINVGEPDEDETPIDYDVFLINNGNDGFVHDTNFPYEKSGDVLSSRKTIVGDFNNDGKADIFRPAGAHDNLSHPHVILSTSEGKYIQKIITDAPKLQPHTVSSGDIDNDGDLDVLLAQAGEMDGFLINDGSANFTWKWLSEIIEFSDDSDGYIYPNGKKAPWGFWSSEITDVDKDGFVDLILGGSYKGNSGGAYYHGPAVLWGDGTGKYNSEKSTTLFDWRNLDYAEGYTISLSHDYAVNDIDGDGINDIAVFSECSDVWLYHIIKGKGNREFEDKTKDWLPNPIIENSITHVWIKLMDVDNNGSIDLVESEPKIWLYTSQFRNSLRWEWNGNGFTKVN
ncbi:VCBS repeat-containing protein, partial [archaeon]|nr:VCBS repeat-containing protein [archaeon]